MPDGYPQSLQFIQVRFTWRLQVRKAGGGGRNRTGVHGFAGRCMTTLPPRRNQKGKTKLRRRLTLRLPQPELHFWPHDLQVKPSRRHGFVFPGIWSGKGVSNSRPQPWQGCALPTELFPRFVRKIIGQPALLWQLEIDNMRKYDCVASALGLVSCARQGHLEVVGHGCEREQRRQADQPRSGQRRIEGADVVIVQQQRDRHHLRDGLDFAEH